MTPIIVLTESMISGRTEGDSIGILVVFTTFFTAFIGIFVAFPSAFILSLIMTVGTSDREPRGLIGWLIASILIALIPMALISEKLGLVFATIPLFAALVGGYSGWSIIEKAE